MLHIGLRPLKGPILRRLREYRCYNSLLVDLQDQEFLRQGSLQEFRLLCYAVVSVVLDI